MVDEKTGECQIVVFSVGDEEFGVDITQVREIIKLVQIISLPKASAYIEGVVNLRGQVLAVIDLAKKLGLVAKKLEEHVRIIIVEVGEYTVGMIVDSVSEVLRLSANSSEAVPELVNTEVPGHYIKGIGKLKDRLLVLLDLNKILTPADCKHVDRHLKAVPA